MSPLWWEILFLIFMITFLTMNIMIYFDKKNSLIPKTMNQEEKKNLNWTW
nr:ATP synthase F0 subunit 8 [Eocanthecona thomsoni]